jgi:hypothetical protein
LNKNSKKETFKYFNYLLKTMKQKRVILFSAFLFSLILASILTLTIVSAATISITTPTASETIYGTYTFTLTNASAYYVNCTWSTTADSNFGITYNTTGENQVAWNISNNTALLTDAASTTLTVTCYNRTASEDSGTQTIAIDNTAPTCSNSLPIGESTVVFHDIFGINPLDASTDAIDSSLTYSLILYDPSGNRQDTSTSSTANFADEDFDEIGTFILAQTVTDNGANVGTCTNLSIDVQGSNGDGTVVTTTQQASQQRNTVIIISVIIVLLILAGLGYFIFSKAK